MDEWVESSNLKVNSWPLKNGMGLPNKSHENRTVSESDLVMIQSYNDTMLQCYTQPELDQTSIGE